MGALQYYTFTRPYIAFAVNYACQFMPIPTNVLFHLVKRLIHYLQGSVDCGLHYSISQILDLQAYNDANWASDQLLTLLCFWVKEVFLVVLQRQNIRP